MNLKTKQKEVTLGVIPQGPGASQNQIATFTHRINHLTNHLKQHKKDHSSKRGLMNLVSKRGRISRYLKETNPALYEQTRKELGLRK